MYEQDREGLHEKNKSTRFSLDRTHNPFGTDFKDSRLYLCFLLEFSQLYQVKWINNIRKTGPGKLVLGQGFLWSDLLAYSLGILVLSCLLASHKNKSRLCLLKKTSQFF